MARRPAFDPGQPAFDFEPRLTLASDGMLAGLDRQVASAVARILKDDERDRYDIAAAMSRIVAGDISKPMLDKYSSETSEDHNISAGRFLVLIAATRRYDVLRALVHQIGCDLIEGEEVRTLQLGHVAAQLEILNEQYRRLKRSAPAIKRGGRR